jgi:hypothetical protein
MSRSVTLADVKAGDIAEISAGDARDECHPDRKESRCAQNAAGVKEDFARHEDRERHEHFEKRSREKQEICIKRERFEK